VRHRRAFEWDDDIPTKVEPLPGEVYAGKVDHDFGPSGLATRWQ